MPDIDVGFRGGQARATSTSASRSRCEAAMLYGYEQFPIIVATLIFLLAGFTNGVIGLALQGLDGASHRRHVAGSTPPRFYHSLVITNVSQLAAGPPIGILSVAYDQ